MFDGIGLAQDGIIIFGSKQALSHANKDCDTSFYFIFSFWYVGIGSGDMLSMYLLLQFSLPMS